jgi:Cof subfamily protein (haloacid dehalogenase superfamily)
MIKAVFFDIDGTLVSFHTHVVPPSAVEALDILRSKGIKVFIASGRHITSINNLGDLQFDGYVTLNGGIVLTDNRTIYKHHIEDSDIEAVIRYQEKHPFPCGYVMQDELYMNYVDESVDSIYRMLNFPAPPIHPDKEVLGHKVYQLIAFFTSENEKEIMSVLPHCIATRWNPLFSDVVPKGIDKSIGLQKMLDYYHIKPEECMAFGDGGNDIPMLRFAGIGVALGGVDQEVMDAADYVTTTVDDNGVYNALKHFQVI